MPPTAPFEGLGSNLFLFSDAVNVGLLRAGDRGLVIDCCSGTVAEAAAAVGIGQLHWALATHYHRDGCAGLGRCRAAGARVAVPAAERPLFEAVERYWQEPGVQFHRYRLRPDTNVPRQSVAVDRGLEDGDVLRWGQHELRAVATPGHTDGGLSYLLDLAGIRYAFVGDLVYGDGQLWELWSLQGPPPGGPVGSQDYHAFCGRARQAVQSLRRLLDAHTPAVLVPAHGPVVRQPAAALATLERRVEALLANYYSVSSMRYYFPEWTARQRDGRVDGMPGQLVEPPAWFRVGPATTRTLIAPSGRALVVDCASSVVAAEVAGWIAAGTIAGVDACFISHYHDDHVGGVAALVARTGCGVWAHRGLADVLTRPDAYCMPCLDPTPLPPTCLLAEGETVQWEGFRLSCYDFPGQTLLHSAMLVERDGTRLLIGGDSFTPGGLDDYCAHNRNLLGPGRGYERCLDLLERLRPDMLVNMHVAKPFILPAGFLAEARTALRERERLLGELLPWWHPNFGLDPQWAHCYPYRQTVRAGGRGVLALQVTNASDVPLHVTAELEIPAGWQVGGPLGGDVAAGEEGSFTGAFGVPDGASPGRFVLTARLWVNERELGAWAEAIVDVANDDVSPFE